MDLVEHIKGLLEVMEDPLAPDQPNAKDRALTLLDLSAKLREVAANLTERSKDVAIKVIDAQGDIEFGTVRYYVSVDKGEPKCKDNEKLLDALLNVTGGDMKAVSTCMSTGAFKPGACRDRLGDEWGKHFSVEDKKKLKEGSVNTPKPPERSLQRFDSQFMRPRSSR